MKHDHIIYYIDNSVFSNRMTCGDRLEIEYTVLSLRKYYKDLGRIFVVGSEPPVSIKDYVIHIPCDNPYKHCKDSNLIHKIRYVIETIPDLTDDFSVSGDDQIITKKTSWSDLVPRVIRKYSDWTPEQWRRNARIDFWHHCLANTMRLFKNSAFFEPHIFSPMNKYKFKEMCDKYDYKHNNYVIKTLYYNFICVEQIPTFDSLHLSKQKSTIAPTLTLENIPRHLSWCDPAFMQKCFRDLLNKIVE